jgi:hypothetical protein
MFFKKILLSFGLLLVATTSLAQETLIFALDLIRHGDRTALQTLPKAPYQWPAGLGQLTAEGMQQEFQNGMRFREKYIDHAHLLPAHYKNNTLYVLSTDFDRTLMSAQAVLLGLYPLGGGPLLSQTGKPALPGAYQPIPIHSNQGETDDLFITDKDKEQYKQLVEKYVFTRADWQETTRSLQKKFPLWSEATGLTLTNIHELITLADTLFIYRIHHIAMPPGLRAADIQQIIAVGRWGFVTAYQTPEIGTRVGQPLLAKIADYLQHASQHKTSLKYVLFSAHDSTIMSLMTTLHVPLTEPPPYAANVNFALFARGFENYVVKATYNGSPLIIPGCEREVCSLAQFMRVAHAVTG